MTILCLAAALLWQDPGQISAELAAGRAAVQAHPESADAHFMLGKSLAMHLHHPAAIPELREALRLGLPPLGAAEAHRWLGYTLMYDGQTSGAKDAFHALAAMAAAPPAWRTEAEGLAGQMEASRNVLRAVSAAERRATWVLGGLALAVLAAFGGGVAQARRAARSAA